MFSQKIYNLYKPLRNHLRPVAIENAFYVIWSYINYFQFNVNISQDIQTDLRILQKGVPYKPIQEWELALLAREMVVNGSKETSLATKNFNNWNYFTSAINKIKDFENNAWPIFGNKNNVLKEMRRIAHRQFPWQTQTPNTALFVKYFKIFSNPKISHIIERKLGLSLQEWYVVGTAIAGSFLTHCKMNIDPNITISGITIDHFNKFLSYTSTDIEQLKQIIISNIQFDDEFIYSFNPLEYYPIVRLNNYYFCPVPTLLYWRMTSGIYFDVINDPSFGNKFGFAFQDFLEEISRIIIRNGKIDILPEKEYLVNKQLHRSVDLIIHQDNHALFVEAKAKRLQAKSKSQLLSDDAIDKDLTTLSEGITQIYSTIYDYRQGLYPHFKFHESTKISPILVTFEDWFMIGEDIQTKLNEKVRQGLSLKGLPVEYLNAMPYTVCSLHDFELLVQALNNHSIYEIMSSWLVPEKFGHNFGQNLFNSYRGEFQRIDKFFPGDFEKIFPRELMKNNQQ